MGRHRAISRRGFYRCCRCRTQPLIFLYGSNPSDYAGSDIVITARDILFSSLRTVSRTGNFWIVSSLATPDDTTTTRYHKQNWHVLPDETPALETGHRPSLSTHSVSVRNPPAYGQVVLADPSSSDVCVSLQSGYWPRHSWDSEQGTLYAEFTKSLTCNVSFLTPAPAFSSSWS